MADDVEIKIKAEDQTQQGTRSATQNFEGMSDEVNKANAAAKTFKDSINKSMLGVNASIEVGKKAAEALGQAYNFLVGDTQQYAQSVLQMMRISGQNAEQTSRMIQLTDDFGVSQEALTMAMRGAATKGIAFTTDNLAKLSDAYLALAPGVERTSFLVDQFGTRGAEMAKVLDKGSKAIREQSAAIADNMVLTDEQIQASEEWRIAQDNLNDSLQGIKYTLGNALIPLLVDAADAYDQLATQAARLKKILDEHNADVIKTSGSYEEYAEEIRRTNQVSEKAVPIWQALAAGFQLNQEEADRLTMKLRIMSEQEYNAAAGAAESDRSLQGMATTLENMPGLVDASAEAIGGVNAKMDTLRAVSDQITDAYNNMNSAQQNLEDATASFSEKVGGDLKSAMEQAGAKGDKLNEGLGIMDDVLGTAYLPAQQLDTITSNLADDFAKGKLTGDEFRQALQDQLQPMKDLYQPIVNARVALQDMRGELEKLTGRVWKIAIEMGAPIPSSSTLTPGGGGGGSTIPKPSTPIVPGSPLRAEGGQVWSNQSYIVGEQGPEMFVPGSSGTIIPNNQMTTNMGGITIIVNGAASPSATANAIKLKLDAYGRQYQGQ